MLHSNRYEARWCVSDNATKQMVTRIVLSAGLLTLKVKMSEMRDAYERAIGQEVDDLDINILDDGSRKAITDTVRATEFYIDELDRIIDTLHASTPGTSTENK